MHLTVESTPILKIKAFGRAKGQSAEQSTIATIATEVDTFPTHPPVPLANTRREAPASKSLEDTDSDHPLSAPRKQRDPIIPPPSPQTFPRWRDRYRQYIQTRRESLEERFKGVPEAIRLRLDEVEKAQGDPKETLKALEKVAHNLWVKKTADLFNENMTYEEGSDSDGNYNYSPDILETVRRILLLESATGEPVDTESGSEGSVFEDEPVSVVGSKRRNQGEKQGIVLQQCRNDMAYLTLCSGYVP